MSNATPPPTPSPAVSELAKKCHQLLGYPEKLVLLEDIEALFIRSEKDRETIDSTRAKDRAEIERLTKVLAQCEADLLAPADWRSKIPMMMKAWDDARETIARLESENVKLKDQISELKITVRKKIDYRTSRESK